jgi:hypothetical protein
VDAEYSGDVPDYAEIRSTVLRDMGAELSISSSFEAPLPARMENRYTVMTVETKIGKGRSAVAIYAEGEADGWQAYITDRRGTREIRTVSVEGAKVAFSVGWSDIGQRRFPWTTRMSWTQGTSSDTYFAFDTAPNHGTASYPD